MKVIKLTTRLTTEERETLISYDYVDKAWHMDSTVPRHFNKALKQGWTPIVKYEFEDGTAAGYVLKASERAITIRNIQPKQLSEKQLNNLSQEDDE